MTPISYGQTNAPLTLPANSVGLNASANVESGDGQTALKATVWNPVSISAEAKIKLIEDRNDLAHYNVDDIDASNLPTGIKKYLSAIRDIQGRIGQRMRALQRVMQDQSLSPAERKMKINQAQFEVSMLNNVLFTVTNGMQQLEMQMKVQLDDLTEINKLMAPR